MPITQRFGVPMQVEITTRCNFDCFYCAGRNMPQGDMPSAKFFELLQQHIEQYGVPSYVSLQGEGEPTLHHDFFKMADAVRRLGSHPYTITNGTHKRPSKFVGLFSHIGVSLDTLDEAEGRKIGRYNIERVLAFIDALLPHITVVVHSVSLGQALQDVAAWCRQRGLHHIAQPLQGKADYRKRYPTYPIELIRAGPFSCPYLREPKLRYYCL